MGQPSSEWHAVAQIVENPKNVVRWTLVSCRQCSNTETISTGRSNIFWNFICDFLFHKSIFFKWTSFKILNKILKTRTYFEQKGSELKMRIFFETTNNYMKMRTIFEMPEQFFENEHYMNLWTILKARKVLQNWKYFKSTTIFSVSGQNLKPDLF